ncbi:hypothetical protein B1218_37145, partial [Pseudomonas ogarae]
MLGWDAAGDERLSHDNANPRSEMGAMAGDTERIEQAVEVVTKRQERQGIGEGAFGAVTEADDVEVADSRQQSTHLVQLVED